MPAGNEPVEASGDDCAERAADDDVEVTFGEMEAVSDEWATDLGLQWRHYYPTTITNVTTSTCLFQVGIAAIVDGEPAGSDDISIVLGPGQSYSFEAFTLDTVVAFTADSEAAEPAEPIVPEYRRTLKFAAAPDYYDAEFTFGETQGSGATATLPLTITNKGVTDGQPDRALSSDEDYLMVNAVDAAGDVVASLRVALDPVIEEGETRTIGLPLGGGYSSQVAVNRNSTNDFLGAVAFEVVDYVPSARL